MTKKVLKRKRNIVDVQIRYTIIALAKNWRDPTQYQLLFGYCAVVISWTPMRKVGNAKHSLRPLEKL
jgi:hypothetical protein